MQLMKRITCKKCLFSLQIILPAIFVAIAMTVALAAPSVDDLPPLELSTLMYYNVTQPRGHFIPFAREGLSARSKVWIFYVLLLYDLC